MRIFVLVAALALAGCAGSPYVGAGLTATDIHYIEFNRDTGRTVATPMNPFGRIAAGVEWQPAPRWRVDLDVAHTSSLRVGNDRGVNSANATVRWFPFN